MKKLPAAGKATMRVWSNLANFSAASLVVLTLAACSPSPPDIKFAAYSTAYETKLDFAQVEHQYPLTPTDLNKITQENLKALDQEQIDQIYARLSAGPIPDGSYEGGLFFPKGVSGQKRLAEMVGGLRGLAVELKADKLEVIGAALWKGKVFYRDQRVLRNRIKDLAILRPLVGDGDIPKSQFDEASVWLLFPAKLYCGQSLLDARRESIVIDYSFTDEVAGYREKPDFLAGRRGLKVRDEIRMVRPGFYLGRAYFDRAFALNFTLYNEAVAKRDGEGFLKTGQIKEDCWTGTQPRVASAR
jgi:hypothetical protein